MRARASIGGGCEDGTHTPTAQAGREGTCAPPGSQPATRIVQVVSRRTPPESLRGRLGSAAASAPRRPAVPAYAGKLGPARPGPNCTGPDGPGGPAPPMAIDSGPVRPSASPSIHRQVSLTRRCAARRRSEGRGGGDGGARRRRAGIFKSRERVAKGRSESIRVTGTVRRGAGWPAGRRESRRVVGGRARLQAFTATGMTRHSGLGLGGQQSLRPRRVSHNTAPRLS